MGDKLDVTSGTDDIARFRHVKYILGIPLRGNEITAGSHATSEKMIVVP